MIGSGSTLVVEKEAGVFQMTCEELEQRTRLSDLEARGTVRLALRSSGLEARTVNRDEMSMVLARVLPRELRLRQITKAEEICISIAEALELEPSGRGLPESSDLDAAFARVFAQ